MSLGWLTDLFGVHPEHAGLIAASLALTSAALLVLLLNYRKARAKLTLLFTFFVLLVIVATLMDLAEHFMPLHPLRMVPMTAALALLLYLLLLE